MPLSKDQMRDYQRKRRGRVDAPETAVTGEGMSPALSRRDKPRDTAVGERNHEHYWLRQDNEVVCVPFHYQHQDIGGCGEKRKYKGKLLDSFDDGDMRAAIARMPPKIIDQWLRLPNGPINTGKFPQRDAP